MDDTLALRLIGILESIDAKLDKLDDTVLCLREITDQVSELDRLLTAMKMDVSGFSHEGRDYPGKLEEIDDTLSEIVSDLSSINGTLSSTSGTITSIDPLLTSMDATLSSIDGTLTSMGATLDSIEINTAQ